MMVIRAMKLTKDIYSTKIIYEKNGELWMRTGMDMFKAGRKLKEPLKALTNKHGFKLVEDAPQFKDSGDIIDNLMKFELPNEESNTIVYRG